LLDLRQLSWTGNPKFGIDYEACTKTEGCSRKCPMGQKHVGMCVVNGKALKPDKMQTGEPKWLHDAGLAVGVVVRTLRSKDEPPKKQDEPPKKQDEPPKKKDEPPKKKAKMSTEKDEPPKKAKMSTAKQLASVKTELAALKTQLAAIKGN
jgi:hypothetical protein